MRYIGNKNKLLNEIEELLKQKGVTHQTVSLHKCQKKLQNKSITKTYRQTSKSLQALHKPICKQVVNKKPNTNSTKRRTNK